MTWNFNRPNQTYRIGERIQLACNFQNVGSIPIHLRRISVWFDWLPQDFAYNTDCNVVYQPNMLALFNPIQNVVADIPLDVSIGHHAFKVGVDYRYWTGYAWADRTGIEWGTPTGAFLDQVLINYPPARNFRVFISHSERDRQFCDIVADYLKRCGQMPYVAESLDNPELGKRLWEEKIENAVKTSNAVLLLWTQNCVSSQAVRYELRRAKELGKRIIPAVESDTNPPEEVKELAYVRFNNTNQIEATKTIVRSLLDFESEASQQRDQDLFGFIALIGLGVLAGAALTSK